MLTKFDKYNEGVRDLMTPKSPEDIEYIKFLKEPILDKFDQALINYIQDEDKLTEMEDYEKRYLLSDQAKEDYNLIEDWEDILSVYNNNSVALNEAADNIVTSINSMNRKKYERIGNVSGSINIIIDYLAKMRLTLKPIQRELDDDEDGVKNKVSFILEYYPQFCEQHKESKENDKEV